MTRPPDLFPLVDSLLEGVQWIGPDWRYRYLNKAALQHARKPASELIGHRMQDCYPGIEHTEVFALIERVMREGLPASMLNHFTFPDGKQGWFRLRVEPAPEGVVVMSIDVTDEKRLEAQLGNASRMEALGRLSGSIAHDFGNLTTVLLGSSELAVQRCKEPELTSDLARIHSAAERAQTLVHKLRAIARGGQSRPRALELVEATRQVAELASRSMPVGIRLDVPPAEQHATAWVDPGSFDQVLLNLVLNARDAMGEVGRLTVQVGTVELRSEVRVSGTETVRAGSYVRVDVQDTGCGIAPDQVERVFEPHFTTKGEQGTGLGLASVYRLVDEAGGYIAVRSELGRGTRISVFLPAERPSPSLGDGGPRIVLLDPSHLAEA